uniref:Putative ovule protein n=1 Tax=Solanum chacoense TaxID=4108 RepID=A0A0V0H417_SOLCH
MIPCLILLAMIVLCVCESCLLPSLWGLPSWHIFELNFLGSASSCSSERGEIKGAGIDLQVLGKSKMDYTHDDIRYDTLVYHSIHDIQAKGQHTHG